MAVNNQLSPFLQFQAKMNKDLAGWLENEKSVSSLLNEYKNTLSYILNNYESQKVLTNIGENCYMKAKRMNKSIVIRCKEDLYVQFSKQQAIPVIKSLIKLHEQKLEACKKEIGKIMVSIKQYEHLLLQYQTMM